MAAVGIKKIGRKANSFVILALLKARTKLCGALEGIVVSGVVARVALKVSRRLLVLDGPSGSKRNATSF